MPKSESEKHTCCGLVCNGVSHVPHKVTATYEHNGRWYCKMHYPPFVQERRAAQDAAWRAKWDKDVADAEHRRRIAAAEQAVIDAAKKQARSFGWDYYPACDKTTAAARELIDAEKSNS